MHERSFSHLGISNQKRNGSEEESVPCDLSALSERFAGGEEANLIKVSVIVDLTVDLVSEESLNEVVELVLVQVAADVAHGVVGPVSVLNTVQQAIVLGDPETVLGNIETGSGVQGVLR